jgi:hypothetical protein
MSIDTKIPCRSNWIKTKQQLTQGITFTSSKLLGENDIKLCPKFAQIRHPKNSLTVLSSNYVHASTGAAVQPVAGTTSDVFCAELYFFVMNLTNPIRQ